MNIINKRRLITINILVVLVAYILPLYILRHYQNSSNIGYIQIITLIAILGGGIILTYINYKKNNEFTNFRILFKILGVAGVIYALVILYFILAFSNGLG